MSALPPLPPSGVLDAVPKSFYIAAEAVKCITAGEKEQRAGERRCHDFISAFHNP